MQEQLNKIEQLKLEIESAELKTKDEIENFRIKFLGTKGLVKELMGEMKNVSSDLKKDFGARLNEFKQFAESKYEQYKSKQLDELKSTASKTESTHLFAGTKIMLAFAPVASTASFTLSKTGFSK